VALYILCRRRWGTGVALLTLFFYSFSPNIIAHSTLVTTDLGASVFLFLGLCGFVRYMEHPTRNNLLLLSLALAAAEVAKFSAILLYPFLGLLTLVGAWLLDKPKTAMERFKTYTGGFIAASFASLAWIWVFYIPHTINMPESVQDRLISGSLVGPGVQSIGHLLMAMNNLEIFKPLVQYLLGVTMVYARVTGGNVTYFNGQVTVNSFHGYFPELFVFKTQVALLIFMAFALVVVGKRWPGYKPGELWGRFVAHVRTHLMEWTIGSFATFYFAVSVAGNLNLGIRHVLPVYVPLFVLVSVVVVRQCGRMAKAKSHWQPWAGAIFVLLLGWYGVSTILAQPNYLSYFNELIGGPANADKYFSDSSVDWGQDLRRLKTYVEKHPEINHIAVDYFGGGVPEYYFCKRKFDPNGHLITSAAGYDCSGSNFEAWHSQYGQYTGQYIAISETFLENDRYYSELNGTPGYGYLRARQPIAKVGYSIYVYKLY
jgi:4-amino-4-deoxy-L-arabinose transferase-like glycosyltransferase